MVAISDIPVIDREAAIARMGGDEELYAEILDVFFEDVPQQIELLLSALQSSDRATGERQAHSLKSAAANIGAEKMRSACAEGERAFHDQNSPIERLHVCCAAIQETFLSLKSFLKR
jgi:HPt (histidine-containing phosphotransfer) domain-containing protein